MTNEEKYVARILFKVKIYESDKQTYEDLFTRVMQNHNVEFKQIKPHGKNGDGKCDGFIKTTGEFYQSYAPEDIDGKEKTGFSKLKTSFNELSTTWQNSGYDVKKFYFVINDKYKSVYQSWYQLAQDLSNDKTECSIFLARDLEDLFLNLNSSHVFDIIGLPPDPLNINDIETNPLHEVVQYIMNIDTNTIEEKIPKNPDFDEKIKFNKLHQIFGSVLDVGQIYLNRIEEYFKINSNYIKEDLRQRFSGFYKIALTEIPESPTKNDEIFQYIVTKSSPNTKKAVRDAVYTLMSYYFEYCDIFEAPPSGELFE